MVLAPADERYLSLSELARSVRDRSRTRVVESALIHVEANRADPERLALILPGADTPVAPTHWSFGQLASLVGAPRAYLRQLPAALAGINLQYGLTSNRAEQIKTLETDAGQIELRAVTARITAASSITNSSRPYSASPATAPAIPAGRSRACSTGRPGSTIPASTSARTPRRSTPRIVTFSSSWSTT
jgi:hypothetical protein